MVVTKMLRGAELVSLIQAAFDAKLASGALVHPSWLATEFIEGLGDFSGERADVLVGLAHERATHLINRAIRNTRLSEFDLDADPQLKLPGFLRAQKYYTVERFAVPVELLTWGEFIEKENEHAAQAKGHMEHRAELRTLRKRIYGDVPPADSASA